MEVYYVDVGFIWLEKKMECFTLTNMDLAAMVDQPVTQINKKEFQMATCGEKLKFLLYNIIVFRKKYVMCNFSDMLSPL